MFQYLGRPAPVYIAILYSFCFYCMTLCAKFISKYKKYFRLWPISLLLAHYSLPYSCKAALTIMDQIAYYRDRPIFIWNFPRWRTAASWIWFNRKLIHTIRQLRKLYIITRHVDRALFAIHKLSQLKAAILFPASKLYSIGYPPIRNLAPMSYASTVMWYDVVSEGKVNWPYMSLAEILPIDPPSPKNPILEPKMKRIGLPVVEIWPFEIFPRWRRPPSWICSTPK